jgi:ParB family chromosome partitioning protein
VDAIVPNPHQPRNRFDEPGLRRLADSILADGLMQPITVRILSKPVQKSSGDTAPESAAAPHAPAFEIVAGERRWRAAQLAGLVTIPAIVRTLDDRQSAEWALIENLQREDLNPVERAFAFQGLTEQFGLTQQDIAERLGLDRSSVSNALRLLALTPKCHQLIIDGRLSMSQARSLAALSDPEAQDHLAQRAVKEGLSVRAVEAIARKLAAPLRPQDGKPKKPTAAARAGQIAEVENALSAQLGTKVQIKLGKKKGSGTLNIAFYNLDHFDQLMTRLGLQAAGE